MKILDRFPTVSRAANSVKLILGSACVAICAWTAPHAFAADAASTAAASGTEFADAIVAVVNNEAITQKELDNRIVSISAQLKNQGTALPPPDVLRRQVLEKIIMDRAQVQYAKDHGIQVDDATLDRTLARIAEQNHMTMQGLRDQIEREGTKFPAFREEIRDEITIQRLRQYEVINKVEVSDSEVDNFLALQSAGGAQTQQEYHLAHILVRIPENATAEVIKERRDRAEAAVHQLRVGADFANVAAQYSDADDALQGGDMGWRGADRLPQIFIDATASLKQGDVTDPIRTANGFHVLKLVGKRAPGSQPASAPPVQETHAKHILIKTNQVVSLDDARRKLSEIKERIDNGTATFEDMAKQYSNDGSASKGGDLGWVAPGDTVPDFEHAMDALKPGQVSDPIETPFGMHLIKVVERRTRDVSSDRKRLAARQALRERKIEERTQDWLSELRDRVYVEYRLDEK